MVEWKKIGEVCEILRGKRLTKSQLNEKNGYPVLHGGSTPMGYYQEYNRKANTTVVVNTGNAGSVFFYDKEFWSSDACYSLYPNESLMDKYLYFYLYGCEQILKGKIRAGAMPTIDANAIKSLTIPIPSVDEQNRIVDILDTFSSSIDNLKEQIAQRHKQLEHYRDQLLESNVFNATVNEVASFGEGRIMYSELNECNYISVENLLKDKGGKTTSSVVPTTGNWPAYLPNDILIGNIRPYLRKIWMANISGGTNGDVVVVRPNALIQPRFLYFTLSSERFFIFYNQTAKGGKMPRGDKKRLLDFEIFLPHISEQQRIVSILETFEASIKNLEAQLDLRQKQYEYYRNKLLTFE